MEPLVSTSISLRNRVVMAPMNRRRATGGIPDSRMTTYYQQRAGAGLIVTDNTSISFNGGGYLNTPGIYTEEQKMGWKKIVDAVHAEDGKIVAQLVHTGRVGHSEIINGGHLVAPSAIGVNETIRIPGNIYKLMSTPVEIDTAGIQYWISRYKKAAVNAMEVGFDGVEVHAAHGFLIDQFLNPTSNQRTDEYGGNLVNRSRFLMEVMREVVAEIGKEKTGIRLSPFREIYGLKPYTEELATHRYIMEELQKMDILYVHFSNETVNGQPAITRDYLKDARERFKNLIIMAGGFSVESGEEILQSGLVDLVAFGKPFISNPDLVTRIARNAPLAVWDEKTFYYGDDKGYIDYPNMIP